MTINTFYIDIQTPYVDTSEESTYFAIKDFPTYLTAGKNHFLIAGTDLLRPGTDVSIQILDSKNNILEFETPDILIDGTHRMVIVTIPDNIEYGYGSVTILGKTLEESNAHYDVKWIKKFLINPTLDNTCPPVFIKNPTIEVQEIYDETQDISNTKYTVTEYSVGLLYSSIAGTKRAKTSRYIITSSDGLATFTNEMIGGTLFINSGNIIPVVGEYSATDYTATITDVLNSTQFVVDVPCEGVNSVTNIKEKFEFKDAVYTITYAKKETFDAKNIRHSYLKLNMKNLNVYSGKVKYVDLYKDPGNVYIGRYNLTSEYLHRVQLNTLADFTDNFTLQATGSVSEIINNKISNTVTYAN